MADETANKSSRQALEQAVTKVGRALDDLTKVFERGVISADDFAKAFAFLDVALHAAKSKAHLSMNLATVASGSFSLDAELPTPIAIMAPANLLSAEEERELASFDRFGGFSEVQPDPAPQPEGYTRDGVRIVGTPRSKRSPATTTLVKPKSKRNQELEDLEDGAGFLDD